MKKENEKKERESLFQIIGWRDENKRRKEVFLKIPKEISLYVDLKGIESGNLWKDLVSKIERK